VERHWTWTRNPGGAIRRGFFVFRSGERVADVSQQAETGEPPRWQARIVSDVEARERRAASDVIVAI